MRNRGTLLLTGGMALLAAGAIQAQPVKRRATPLAAISSAIPRVPVTLSGGHGTDPRDRGRPVILVASALGVPPEIFRKAFTRVHPAPAGSAPTPDEARQNKAVLLNALGPYGVTNDQLDAVSNYYRYVRSRGELWPTTPAAAVALVRDGRIVGYEVTRGGSGYTSPPTVSVPEFPNARASVRLSFSRQAETNGAVAAIEVVSDPAAP